MGIADAIITQIQQAGQPRTIKSTETVTGKEPIDIGGLGLLLYMLLQGMGKKGPQIGETALPGAREFLGGTMPTMGLAPSTFPASQAQSFGGMDPMQLIKLILSGAGAGAGAGAPGVGGF